MSGVGEMMRTGFFRYVVVAGVLLGFCSIAAASELSPGERVGAEAETSPAGISVKADPSWGKFFGSLREIVQQESRVFLVRGREVRMNPTWLRDHIHEMKGFKYWEKDVTSALDEFLSRQAGDGFFYEMIISAKDPHTTFSGPKFALFDRPDGLAFVRLQMEADIEYLMVEGVHTAWQATGDDEWMRQRLESLEKGLEYCMTDPTRWCQEHQLVKRTFCIDTWDFTFFLHPDHRSIESGMTMSIMHGDNSGMFDACRRLAAMWRHLKDEDKAAFWEFKAREFKERTNRLCWNGKFYTHQVMLEWPTYLGDVPETEILSLSNTYDINRGIAEHWQCASIIREYISRKEKTESFAEWFTIDPPYPRGCVYPPGKYINGAVSIFVAGELAKAAFKHGFESYGVDILKRVKAMCERDGTLGFFYSRDGKPEGGGPPGWGASAVASAIIEGLAGIEDSSKLYRTVSLSPRWIALGIEQAEAVATYPAGDAGFRYTFRHDGDKKEIAVSWDGAPDGLEVHLLLPHATQADQVLLRGEPVSFRNSRIESSSYVDLTLPKPPTSGRPVLTITYKSANPSSE
jgi:hypothetical protein